MRLLLFLFILAPNFAISQKYLLLDRKWDKPAHLADTVTKEDVSQGFFPIETRALDSITDMVGKFKDLKKDGLNRKFYNPEEFKTSITYFEIESIRRTYGDGYDISMISIGDFGNPKLKISDPRVLLPENQKTVRTLLKYLEATQKNLAGGKLKRNRIDNRMSH